MMCNIKNNSVQTIYGSDLDYLEQPERFVSHSMAQGVGDGVGVGVGVGCRPRARVTVLCFQLCNNKIC